VKRKGRIMLPLHAVVYGDSGEVDGRGNHCKKGMKRRDDPLPKEKKSQGGFERVGGGERGEHNLKKRTGQG